MQAAKTVVSLEDENGKEILSFTPEKIFQSVTYSSDLLKEGETYTFFINGEEYKNVTLDGTVTIEGEGERQRGGRGAMGADIEMGGWVKCVYRQILPFQTTGRI